MAYYRIEYFSNCLRRTTAFEMIIPNDPRNDVPQWEPKGPMRTLFLLHGYSGKAGNWVPEELCQKYNFAIVMPTAENSFYLNGAATGSAYQSMVGEELVDYVRKTFGLAKSADETYIAGMSMGGFGAMHTALAYPDRFGKAGALSSALIVHGIAGMKPGEDNGVANYEYYRACFGDLDKVSGSIHDPWAAAEQLRNSGRPLPTIYQAVGTEDFLYPVNQDFRALMEKLAWPDYTYEEGPGGHVPDFTQPHLMRGVALACSSP